MFVNRERTNWIRMMCWGCRIVFTYVVLTVGNAKSEEPQINQLLPAIANAFEVREAHKNPVWVRFELDRFESMAWQRVTRRKRVIEYKWTVEGEYARKGKKTRSWCSALHPSESQPGREDFRIFNGEIMISCSNQEKTFMLSSKADDRIVVPSPFQMSGEENLLATIKMWLSGKSKLGKSLIMKQQQGDEESTVVDCTDARDKWRIKAWLVSGPNWLLRRYEIYNLKGEVQDRFEVQDYGEMDGLSFPMRGMHEHFIPGGGLGTRDVFRVKKIETQANKIPDHLFQVEFPKDALLWDEDLKVMVRNTEVTETHLKEVVERAGPPKNLWVTWVLVLLAGTIVVVLIVWVFYRRRRKHRQGAIR